MLCVPFTSGAWLSGCWGFILSVTPTGSQSGLEQGVAAFLGQAQTVQPEVGT